MGGKEEREGDRKSKLHRISLGLNSLDDFATDPKVREGDVFDFGKELIVYLHPTGGHGGPYCEVHTLRQIGLEDIDLIIYNPHHPEFLSSGRRAESYCPRGVWKFSPGKHSGEQISDSGEKFEDAKRKLITARIWVDNWEA